jgi:hypothetical protein
VQSPFRAGLDSILSPPKFGGPTDVESLSIALPYARLDAVRTIEVSCGLPNQLRFYYAHIRRGLGAVWRVSVANIFTKFPWGSAVYVTMTG